MTHTVTFTRRGIPGAVVALAGAALLLLAGCSAEQTVEISGGRAGRSTVDIVLNDFLVSYVRDLSASVGAESDRIFDPAAVEARLAELDYVALERVAVPEPNRLSVTVAFDDLGRALTPPEDLAGPDGSGGDDGAPASPLSVEREGARTRMVLEVTPELLDAVIAMSPWQGTLLAEILLPPDRTTMSEDDYIDYLVWALEEYEDPRVIRAALEEAMVNVLLRVPGRVVDQRGGTRGDQGSRNDETRRDQGARRDGGGSHDDGVLFRIPVVDLITLDEPRRYEVVYIADS